MSTGDETERAADAINDTADAAGASAANPAKRTLARRSAVLLVSCGLWLLYFDLLTSMPGCTPTSDSNVADASVDGPSADAPPPSYVDAPPPSYVDAPPTSYIDADTTDADTVLDSGIDAALIDAPDYLDASIDGPDYLDAPIDAPLVDAPASGCVPPLTIVSVYPSGGETSATYNHDFVSIRNRTNAPLNLAGYSLQVNNGSSTFDWTVIALAGTVPANGFHLVRLGSALGDAGAGTDPGFPQQYNGFDLPAVGGRVAIVSGVTPLTGPGPFTSVDLVGYGSTYTSESGAVTYSGATNKGMTRAVAGCTDTDHNSADLTEGTPIPYDGYFNPPGPCACN